MWISGTVNEELNASRIEAPPRELFLKYLSKEHTIVDAGCGFGKWLIYLHRRGYKIIGIDNNEVALTKLREFDDTIQVEAGDILDIDYPENYFDAYISMGVIEHFEEGPHAALKEAYRLLKPGGLIFVSVPTVNTVRRIYWKPLRDFVYSFLKSLVIFHREWRRSKSSALRNALINLLPEKMKKILSRGEDRFYHFTEYRYTRSELENFLKQSGFEVIETRPHDFTDSKDYAIGLALDFPFLRSFKEESYFKLNPAGKLVSRILDGISPWIACASVICVSRSLK